MEIKAAMDSRKGRIGMKRLRTKIRKFLGKVLIAAVVIGLAFYLLSVATGLPLVDAFQYAGMACILVGLLSLVGKMNITSDLTYLQSRSVSEKSVTDSSLEDFKSRSDNYRFITFMLATAALLIGFSFLLDRLI